MTSIPVAKFRFSDNNFKRIFLKKKWLFFGFLFHFWNVDEIYKILKKKKSILALLLPKLLDPKEIFTEASKRSCFSTPFGNQRVKGFETLLKSPRHHYFPIFQWFRDKLSWKMSVLVTSKIFRLFFNTLTPDDKYSRRNMQIFWQHIQRPLSQKVMLFFDFWLHFWNVHEIYNILKKRKSMLA